jgi:hypothetical protein
MLDTYGYKYTQSDYVILKDFPQQQCLNERVSLLRYAYTACLVSPTHVHPSTRRQITKSSRVSPKMWFLSVENFSCRHSGT